MKSTFKSLAAAAILVVATGLTPVRPAAAPSVDIGPALSSIGVLAFSPDGVLFAADPDAATIYALELGDQSSARPGAGDVAGIDQKIAALLGTDAASILVRDLAIHPKTKNAYISLMRGTGADAKPALLRVDGAGAIVPVALDTMKYTKVALPNPPAAAAGNRNPRADTITDMAYTNGRVVISGLSNEEFASKLRSVAYPFTSAETGTSVEIFHGNHGRLETRSPVYTFLPYSIGGKPYIIASYTCTPLVRFPVESLAGSKVLGTTIAELGAGNRPLDMVLYTKGGREFLLMSNNSRGVMKIPTEAFGSAPGITEKVQTETGGIAYEKITAMQGVEQLDLLDGQRSIVLTRGAAGLNLAAVALP